MHSVSAFFTAYSARLGGDPVEAVAVVISDGPGTEPLVRFVVVSATGRASLVGAQELDLYGVTEDGRAFEEEQMIVDAAKAQGVHVELDRYGRYVVGLVDPMKVANPEDTLLRDGMIRLANGRTLKREMTVEEARREFGLAPE